MISGLRAQQPQQLSADDVTAVLQKAALTAAGERLAVVVVDRPGNVLGVYRRSQASDDDVEVALSLARTGAFFSNKNTPLSSRTVRSISRVNFPEGIPNQPSGALFGIENTNRGCDFNAQLLQEVPRQISAAATIAGIDNIDPQKIFSRGIGVVPGGIALYRGGSDVVGGVGVFGLDGANTQTREGNELDEFTAVLAGTASDGAGGSFFVHLPLPDPGSVYLDGFRLPFVFFGPSLKEVPGLQTPAGLRPGTFDPSLIAFGPRAGKFANEGWLVGPLAGQKLSKDEVFTIVANAIETAGVTRAGIRLPVGQRTRMVISVADLDGTVLALFRMQDSTIFSIDVALSKARNVVYFSGPTRDPRDLPGVPMGTAVTNRTIGFGSQTFFPSGIFNSKPGPFADLYQQDIANPCTQGSQSKFNPDGTPNLNQSGIVFFPGSAPLYRSGQMVGGLGVSGDGVEQDDFVNNGGTLGFEAPVGIRADQIFIRGVRLPYFKFPRNPEQ